MPGPTDAALAEAPARLADAVGALGPSPTTDAVLGAFAAWCRDARFPAARHDHAWVAVTHPWGPDEPAPGGDWGCTVELARELAPRDGGPAVVAAVTLRFPLPPALRARLDDPHQETSWAEAPARCDRAIARFRAALGPLLAPFAPRVSVGGLSSD